MSDPHQVQLVTMKTQKNRMRHWVCKKCRHIVRYVRTDDHSIVYRCTTRSCEQYGEDLHRMKKPLPRTTLLMET